MWPRGANLLPTWSEFLCGRCVAFPLTTKSDFQVSCLHLTGAIRPRKLIGKLSRVGQTLLGLISGTEHFRLRMGSQEDNRRKW